MNITFTTIYKKQKKHAYHIIAICLLAVGICFFSCSKESKLSGVVIDRDTKNGIKDIEVILISTDTTKVCTTYTGANGIYKFNPPPSNYKIIINRDGPKKNEYYFDDQFMVSVPVKGKVIAETTLLIPNNVKLYIRTAIDTAINIFNEILYNSYITDIRTRIVRTVYTIRDSFFSYAIHKFSKKEAAHYYDAFNYSLMRTTTIFLNSASSKEHIILKGPTWYYGGPSFEAYMGALYELMYLNSKSNDFFLDIYKGYKIITADSSDVIVKRFENLCKTRGIKLAE